MAIKIKELKRVRAAILAAPKRFIMRNYILGSDPGLDPGTGDSKWCGTSGCIAGHAVGLTYAHNRSIPERARDRLGLNYAQGARLFIAGNWPEPFRKIGRRHHREGQPHYAKNAALRIDHFIATKGRE